MRFFRATGAFENSPQFQLRVASPDKTPAPQGRYSAADSFLANPPQVAQIADQENSPNRMIPTRQYDYLNRLPASAPAGKIAQHFSAGTAGQLRIVPPGTAEICLFLPGMGRVAAQLGMGTPGDGNPCCTGSATRQEKDPTIVQNQEPLYWRTAANAVRAQAAK